MSFLRDGYSNWKNLLVDIEESDTSRDSVTFKMFC